MDPLSELWVRIGFVSETYRVLYRNGFVDSRDERCLRFSDTTWIAPGRIGHLGQRPNWFVPFARSGRKDQWGWDILSPSPFDIGDRQAAYWPIDSVVASRHAPSVMGCVYRLMVEELSSTWLVDVGTPPSEVEQLLRHQSNRLSSLLPSRWAERLRDFTKRPFKVNGDGTYGFLDEKEAEDIIVHDLAFPGLNDDLIGRGPLDKA